MSIAGFDRLRETGRFSTPSGPGSRKELTAAGDSETTIAHQSPCPESEFCAKQLELVDLDVPSGDIDPNAEATIRVRLANHAQAILLTDPDECGNPANPCQRSGTTNGYCALIRTRPAWAEFQETLICSNLALIPPKRKEVDIPLPAPGTEGELDVAVSVVLPASGERTQEIVETISYRQGGSTAPPPPGDGKEEDGFLGEATALVGAIGATLAILVVLGGLVAIS